MPAARCCACTATRSRRTCGARSSRPRPARAGARWPPTFPATATRRPIRRTRGSGWSTPSTPSMSSGPLVASRCASTTGAGSSACAGPATTPRRCARSSSARPASSRTASGTAWPRRCAPRARARGSSTARRARRSARCSPPSLRASASRRSTSTSRPTRTPCAAAASSSSIARATSPSSSPIAGGSPPSASRRCCSSAPRTPSRASPPLIASRRRSRTRVPRCSTGIGHFMFDEVPERAAAIVVDFLAAV